MSVHQAFRRSPVPPQVSQKLQVITIPAPTRGLIESENLTYMQPGGAVLCDNWKPTMKGLALRGGCIRWCDLYPGLSMSDPLRKPVISAFEYASGNVQKMFAGSGGTLFDITAATATVVKSGQASDNYSSSQLANASDDYLLVVNDAGDFPLRYDGTTWTTLDADQITGPPGSAVEHGRNLTYVWKYRNRWFFIEIGTMNAWYLGINSIGGALQMIPLSGAATKGGKLLFGATWTIDAGDGLDDKCVFCTDLGELLIFTGGNPGDAANWRQEGRYQIPKPMGMNAHVTLGGDLLIATTDGIVPISAAITKDAQQLELSMITRNIKPTWRNEALAKNTWAWTMERWDEYGAMFVTWPGGKPGAQICGVVNTATGAWTRYVGWDAVCFVRVRGDMFFGTQKGLIMQADRKGTDDGVPYTCSVVGGWEMFQSPSQTVVWRQALATFTSRARETFNPQITACLNYIIALPPPPTPGPDPGIEDVWDEGLWDQALWDQESVRTPSVRSTGWVSVGMTGYSHAPVVQVMVAQTAKPDVELVSITAVYERCGVNV